MNLYWINVWQVLLDLAPWLLLGCLLAGVLHVLLPSDFVRRHLGRPGFASTFKAALFGVPLPLCSCGVIPAAIGLKKDGASDGACISFLISTPQTGVDSITVSASFLGLPFALFKVFSAFITGLLGGVLVDRWPTPRREPLPATADGTADTCAPKRRRAVAILEYGLGELLYMIWRWVVVGVLVSAAITTWIPPNYFQGTFAGHGVVAMFVTLLVSLPLYVCATSSVPIAAALVQAGMPTGAALVFLMAGPASNAATIGAVYRAFGGRVLAIYLLTISLSSMVLGYLFDFVITARPAAAPHLHHHGPGWWALASAVVLLGLLVWFAARDLKRWWRRPGRAPAAAESRTIEVRGMDCEGCANHVRDELLECAGVVAVEVNLEAGSALVQGQGLTDQALREAVERAGYTPGEVRP